MATERFLITGGQGFIGAWIARTLIEEGAAPVILDRVPDNSILSQILDPEQLPHAERVFCDIADAAKVRQAVANHGVTHIIHLAGLQMPACRAAPLDGARVNVLGTLNVFEAAKGLAGQVRGIAYASSAAVAGEASDYGEGPIQDGAAHLPRSHYGVFKAANEGNARVYWSESRIPSVGLRPYTVYGVGREIGITSGPTKAIKAAVLQRRFTIPFCGASSFVYVEDLARIFIAAARAIAFAGSAGALALNVRGTVATVEEFLATLARELPEAHGRAECSGAPLPVAFDFDESGLAALLGGSVPRTELREGILRTATRFRQLARLGRLHDRDLAG